MMDWNKENTLYFIEMVKERPVIWNSLMEDYRNKNKRNDAFAEIALILGATKGEMNAKWLSLKGQFSREKKKVTGLRTGSGAADIYISKWYGYQEMAGLLSCNIPQDSITNHNPIQTPGTSTQSISLAMPSPPPMTPTLPPMTPTPPPMTPTPPPMTPTPPPMTPTPPPMTPTPPLQLTRPPKRVRNTGLYTEAMSTLKAIKDRKTSAADDEITAYGNFVAAQIRKLRPMLQSRLKLDIQNLIYKYEIENLSRMRTGSSMSNNTDDYCDLVPSPSSSSGYSTQTQSQEAIQPLPDSNTFYILPDIEAEQPTPTSMYSQPSTSSYSTTRTHTNIQEAIQPLSDSNTYVILESDIKEAEQQEFTTSMDTQPSNSSYIRILDNTVVRAADNNDNETETAIENLLKFNK